MYIVSFVLIFAAFGFKPTLQQYQGLTNSVVDYLIGGLRKATPDATQLPNITHDLKFSSGVVTLEHGVLNGFKGLFRAGDVKLTAVPKGLVEAEIHLQFKDLRAYFGKYSIKIGHFSVASGKVDSVIEQHSASLGIVLKGSICNLQLKTVKVTLNKFKLKLSTKIPENIMKFLLNSFDTAVKETLEQILEQRLTEWVKDFQSNCLSHKIHYNKLFPKH